MTLKTITQELKVVRMEDDTTQPFPSVRVELSGKFDIPALYMSHETLKESGLTIGSKVKVILEF